MFTKAVVSEDSGLSKFWTTVNCARKEDKHDRMLLRLLWSCHRPPT